jgi:acyl dehydratase
VDLVGDVHSHRNIGSVVIERHMTLDVTEDLVRAYSRRGNFHSDAETATALGMPGLVAQGVQIAGPAYHLLLDEWGEAFLAHGEIELSFVGMVVAGDSIDAGVVILPERMAAIEVTNTTAGKTAVVGTATCS